MRAGTSVLVTGGTGSFGRAFVAAVLAQPWLRRLVVFSRDECKQHEMAAVTPDPRLRFFLGDVRDPARLARAMDGVDFVVHAAAMKQIPACEANPFEAVQTNILGARHVIDAAIGCGVERVVALSTDKAVNPVNLYGATKLCAEKLFVQANGYASHGRTRFAVVRYGNVVGSRGSVVPVFLAQRARGRLTLTDAAMTRFWITLEQGTDFVLRCAEWMRGGEIFVPKIPSMRVLDVALALVPEAVIETVGIRPAEKLHESLLSEEESCHAVEYPDHFVIEPVGAQWNYLPRTDGKAPPPRFVYTSNQNDRWLTKEDLVTMIDAMAVAR